MSRVSPLMFFSSEKKLFSLTYLLKKTAQMTKILIFPVWNKILKIWDILLEIIQIEVQWSKNCFKIFRSQEAKVPGNDIEKKSQKPHSKSKKHIHQILTENIGCLSRRCHDDIKVWLVQSQDLDVRLVSQIDIVMRFIYNISAMLFRYRGWCHSNIVTISECPLRVYIVSSTCHATKTNCIKF